MPEQKHAIWFVYDGACPICNMGANLYQVRQSVGSLHTVDARTESDHPLMQEVNAAGLDLDAGMVIKYNGTLYQGAGALHIMAQLGAKTGWFNHINTHLFHAKPVATLAYPFLRAARNMALLLKGEKKIRNLQNKGQPHG